MNENSDNALLYRLRALKQNQTDQRSKALNILIEARYKQLRRTFRYYYSMYAAEFNPDGKWVIARSQNTILLWDASSGKLVNIHKLCNLKRRPFFYEGLYNIRQRGKLAQSEA